MTETNYVSVSIDALLSGTTHLVSTTVDALISKPGQTVSTSIDAKLVRTVSVSIDALIVDPNGTFRGTLTTADRDALPALQPQDTVLNIDASTAPSGVNVTKAQYWTGSAWLSGNQMESPVSGVTSLFVAPTTAGWRVEMGDPTYPIRYWNGTTTNFSVDNAGDVAVSGSVTAGSFVGGSIDIPSLGGAGFHVDTAGNVGAGGATSATTGKLQIAASGSVTGFDMTIQGSTSSDTPLFVSKPGGSGRTLQLSHYTGSGYVNLFGFYALSTDRLPAVTVGPPGTQPSWDSFDIRYGDLSFTGDSPVIEFKGAGTTAGLSLALTPSSTRALIVRSLFPVTGTKDDVAIDIFHTSTSSVGNPATNYIRVYNDGNVLKWRNSSGTIYDLSAFSTTTLATDALWDALGDLAYGSGADTGAKLAGNTTTTQKFLTQTGNGSVSAAPAWFDLFGTANVFTLKQKFSAGAVAQSAALATNATTGFLYVPSCAGTPTGTPATETGTIPLIYDSTNNRLYGYSNAAWKGVELA